MILDNTDRNAILAILAVSSAVALPAFVVSTSLAQSRENVIINQEDGQAPNVAYFSHPDFGDLRHPDFIKRDLPIFRNKLVLSDEQLAAVERRLEAYLEAFEKLTLEQLPKDPSPQGIVLALGEGPDGLHPAGPHDMPMLEDGGMIGGWSMDEMEGEMPEGMGVGVDVRIGVGGPPTEDGECDGEQPVEGGDDAPPSSVSVMIETPDGQEIPEEIRQKLEEAAAQMAEKIKKQIEEGGGPGAMIGGPGGMMGGHAMPNLEEIDAYHQEMEEKAEEFRAAKAALRQLFVSDVQTTTLAVEQIERWPALERTLLRVKTLPKGRLSGERTDLVKVLDGLEIDEAEQSVIAEQVSAYELAMDNALRVRNEYLIDAQSKINKAMHDQDADKALSIIDRASDLRVAVRNVNAQFTDTIAWELPADEAAEFREEVLRISYPRIYGKTFAEKTFEAVGKIDGVDQNAIDTIAEFEKAYGLELDTLNAQIRQTVDRYQPLETRRPIEHMKELMQGEHEVRHGDGVGGIMMIGDQGENPIKDAFARRRELDDRFAKQIAALLTPEQAAQLPNAPSRRVMEPMVIEIPASPQ